MPIRAIVPLKSLSSAKGRLSRALDAAARAELVAWMATHVIQVCQACTDIEDVLVVAGDEAAADVGRAAGAAVLVVREPGLLPALTAADVASAGWSATVVVAADLPDVTVEDLRAVVAAADAIAGPAVVVAPTHDGGTGALLRRPGAIIAPAYGAGSAARHLSAARAGGVAAIAVAREGLARDIDTPEQLSPALASRQQQVVRSASPPRHDEESACRKAP